MEKNVKIYHAMEVKHILRIYIPIEKQEERLSDIINYCQRTGCREVLLFTSSSPTMPSFIPISEIENYSNHMIKWAKYLRLKGIEVSVNVVQTLGHVSFPKNLSKEFPFQRKVYIDGTESNTSACPLDKNLQKYLVTAYQLYARVKPRILFVDDDFRFICGGMGCFCPLHLKALEKRLGKRITLEELRKSIFSSSFPPNPVKEQFHQVLKESLVNLAKIIGNAVRKVSPETRVGYMSSFVPHSLWGCDINEVTKTLAGDRKPLYRPQMPMYREIELKRLPRCFAQPMLARNLLDKNVEIYPEIENSYYTVFSKSARMTFLQMAICILNGLDNLALNLFDMFGTPFSEGEEFIEMLSKKKKFFNTLKKLIPTGTCSEGIAIPLTKDSVLVRRALEKKQEISQIIDNREWDNIIPLLGLPLGFNWDSTPFIFLTGDEILGMEKEKIDSILRKGAVMDIRAAECLCHLGYSERIGIRTEENIRIEKGELYVEHFKDNISSVSDNYISLYRYSISSNIALIRKIEIMNNRVKVLSSIEDRNRKEITPAVVIYENQTKERFGILCYSPLKDYSYIFFNKYRKIQMMNLFCWVARKDLPVFVVNAPYVQPTYLSVNGKKILGLVNFSTDIYQNIILSLPEIVNRKFKVHLLCEDGKIENIQSRAKWIESGSKKYLSLELDLIPASLVVLIFEL